MCRSCITDVRTAGDNYTYHNASMQASAKRTKLFTRIWTHCSAMLHGPLGVLSADFCLIMCPCLFAWRNQLICKRISEDHYQKLYQYMYVSVHGIYAYIFPVAFFKPSGCKASNVLPSLLSRWSLSGMNKSWMTFCIISVINSYHTVVIILFVHESGNKIHVQFVSIYNSTSDVLRQKLKAL